MKTLIYLFAFLIVTMFTISCESEEIEGHETIEIYNGDEKRL